MNLLDMLQTLIDAVSFGGLYALLALGVALIFGIMRLINFAHGELLMAGGFAIVVGAHALPLWLLFALVLASCVVLAVAIDVVAFRPVRHAAPATLLITSFAVSYLLKNLAIMVFGSLPKTVEVSPVFDGTFAIGDLTVSKVSVISLVTVVVAMLLLGLFLKRTSIGLQMRAAAEDFSIARVLGVRVNTVIGAAFALSGALAGIASILLVAQTGTVSPSMGLTPVLIAFIAVVVGGLGSLRGAVVGGLLLGVVTVVLQAYLPEGLRYYRDAFAFSLVILVLVLRPQGIIVSKGRVERV